MNDNAPETRAPGWDDDGNVVEAVVTALTALAAVGFSVWFLVRLAQVLV